MSLFRPSFLADNRRAYTAEDRAQNRRELVTLILKDHFTDLVPCNLLLLAAFLPFLFWFLTGAFYIMDAMGADGTFADLLSLTRTWVLGMLPCLLITGPVLAGVAVMLRNLARDDFRFSREYFMSGIQECWKPALAVSASTGLIPLLIWAATAFYGPMILSDSHTALIPLLLTVLLCTIWQMTVPTLYMMLGTYELPLVEQIKNAFALTLSHLPLVTGVHLITLLPLLIGAAAFLISGKIFVAVLFALCMFYLFFGLAFSQLCYAFLANKLCEENLNPMIGESTHIGMD